VIDVLGGNLEAASTGVAAKLLELSVGALVSRGDSCVEGDALEHWSASVVAGRIVSRSRAVVTHSRSVMAHRMEENRGS
jgi:hypothetical protein